MKKSLVAIKNSRHPTACDAAVIQNVAVYEICSATTPPSSMPAPKPKSHDVSIDEFAVPRSLWWAVAMNMLRKAGYI